MEEKLSIKNRKGQKVVALIEKPGHRQKGLVFVMHGLSGFKEQAHIELYAKTFLANDYAAVRFDTTNTFGESDGGYEDATVTNYYEDLEDVIAWAKSQPWYQEPFCLAGSSLGALCVALYAEKFPERVKALAPTSTVVSGMLSMQSEKNSKLLEEWKRTGWRIENSKSRPGVVKRLKWSHMEDRLKYDLLPNANKLAMPVLFIVGSEDDTTPPEHQKMLYEKIPGRKEMHIIEGAKHTFKEEQHLKEIGAIIDQWIKTL
jgi:pimeloyl-ACP methyl ester carboxylesterase